MDPDATNQSTNSSPKTGAINDLVDSMSKINIADDISETDKPLDNKNDEHPARTLLIYSRPQMLKLCKSPLVKPPDGMPALKDWFGSENEQSMHKKEGEGSSPTSARDRRFRRDPEDGDPPARPSFRGTTTQPSQMGNFKHQSIRSTDRNDRDKDGEKERERDIRDKDGHEKLRNLSEKYDRDRLALPSNSTNLRNKERDVAPHLNTGSSRGSNRDGPLNPASRRPEPREGPKKKTIEASEDWRRGADSIRTGRDDRTDNSRRDRDRDDRERPRSRVRDSSRPRRERSTSGREREERDRERDRDRRGDRERDDYRRDREDFRRERDDYLRRDRDLDKDVDVDDPRRWRDDGKRDERVAARREREHRDRIRDRPPREDGWEERHGGRWTVVEDRDSRNKRSSGRDRRSGILDDGKEKDDRKERDRDREREKEKEKEPAWMDTYIPTSTGAGILGGKGGEGELDGIQAFKKGMKAKEQKDLSSDEALEPSNIDGSNGSSTAGIISSSALSSDKPLDEIQLFKLMMKKEQEQKNLQKLSASATEPTLTGPSLKEVENGVSGLMRIRDQRIVSTPSNGEPGLSSVSEPQSALERPSSAVLPKDTSTPTPPNERILDPPKTLLSILSNPNGVTPATLATTAPTTPSLDSTLPKPSGSRFFPKPLSSDVSSPVTSDQGSTSSQAPPQFNPPPGSRLLAFGTRSSSSGPGLPSSNQQPPQQLHGIHPSLQQHQGLQMPLDTFQNTGISLPQLSDINHRPAMSEASRAQQGFPSFELQSRSTFALDDSRDVGNYGHNADPLRRTSVASTADRQSFSVASESNSTYSNMSGSHAVANSETFSANGSSAPFDPVNNGLQYSSGKGSRFLKYFEEKGRDAQTPGVRKPQGPVGFQSSSPNPGQRQDQVGFNGSHADNRMDELFAMLVQGQRVNSVNQMGPGPAPGGGHFGQNNPMQSLQQQQQQQQIHHQHLTPNNRLDSLYESRLDDRNFVPDGMVPGLRQAPLPRNRENNGMFADPLDDPMQFNPHRLPPQQRVLDHNMYPGGGPSIYPQPNGGGRHAGMPLQQPQFRGNPSPNPLQGPTQQRLPPGLANLGGRPPHEPSQFLNSPLGMQPSGGIHGPLHGNGPSPQPFNNFGAGAGLGGYGGNPQMRGLPLGAHQLPNTIGPNQMGPPSGMDMRGPSNQAQLLGLGAGPNVGGALRGAGGGFISQQGPPMQAPLMAMRQQQQQQQHLPHMMPPQSHHLPHLQQQGLPSANPQDLMALLMGNGTHRE